VPIKAICKECINRLEPRRDWDQWDESRWKEGVVMCLFELLKTDDPPPERCPFALEQAVSRERQK